MSKYDDAIDYWQTFKQEAIDMIEAGQDIDDTLASQITMSDIAIEALREAAERDKGCDWCKVGKQNARTVWIDGSFDAFTGERYAVGSSRKGRTIDRSAKFCPMCGRKLTKEPTA